MSRNKQLKKWHATSSLPLLSFLLQVAVLPTASAAPYIPQSDDEVLARLVSAPNTAAFAATPAAPTDTSGIAQAQQLLLLAYSTGHEDAYGQIEALLQPWVRSDGGAKFVDPAAPAEVRLMLARVWQHDHKFESASIALSDLLSQTPNHVQARMERAQINLVTGAYPEARADCAALSTLVSSAQAANCMAQVNSVTGQAETIYAQLRSVVAYRGSFNEVEYTELLLTLATTAHRLGKIAEAEAAYRSVLGGERFNSYALLHYTDLLLEQARAAEALALLQSVPSERRSLEVQVKEFEAALGNAGTANQQHREQLTGLFAIARARGENFPHKEYARFLLLDPDRREQALDAARQNWQVQKEPSDLLLLVRAARSAGDTATLDVARDWLAKTALEDRRIESELAPR